MSFNDYRIVGKSFEGERRYIPGEAVNVSNFRNVRGLEEGRYLRRPTTDEDYQLINKTIEGAGSSPAPKRGRPPGSGGEN